MLDDLRIAVEAEGLDLLDGVASRLQLLVDADRGAADIAVQLFAADDPSAALPRPRGASRSLFERAFAYDYYASDDVLRLAEGGVVALCDPADASIRIAVRASDERARFNSAHLFFSLSLLELLKRRGRFAVHAASIASAGRGVLIAGPAGAGKTTLSLAAARAGWDFMGDDVALIRAAPDGALTLVGFPDQLDLLPDAARFFPDLGPIFATHGPGVGGKHALHPRDAAGRVVLSATPALVVFPRIVRQGPPSLSPITADEALVALVPNVIRTQPVASQWHLDTLAALARRSATFALEFSDPLTVPQLMHAQLATMARL